MKDSKPHSKTIRTKKKQASGYEQTWSTKNSSGEPQKSYPPEVIHSCTTVSEN